MTVGDQIDVSGVLSSITDEGKQVAATSDEGFPWQMSVHIEPRSVEEVKAGATVTVNGRTFQGPINVFRNNVIREISFTPTGWDSQTSAVAMAHGSQQKGTEDMDPKELEKLQQQAAAAAKFEAEAKTAKEAQAKAEADLAAEKAKVKEFEATAEKARKDKREADIRSLFKACGSEFTEDAAKPYRDLSEDAFAAISEQMKTSAKQRDPKLFSEQATDGLKGGQPTAEQLSKRANEIVFAAQQKGQHIDVVDAVKQAKTEFASERS